MRYSVVIATLNRHRDLALVIDCLILQTQKPSSIVIIDASSDELTEQLINNIKIDITIVYEKFSERSSAKQRNRGAELVESEIVAFLDDDVEFDKDIFKNLIPIFKNQNVGAISPCQEGGIIKNPSYWLWLYYRFQAGYYHPSYGGQLFGPGINCYPTISQKSENLIKSNWLPATFLLVKKEVFDIYKFPNFTEYSFAEDVYLTHLISKSYLLYFISNQSFKHYSRISDFKKDSRMLIKMKTDNMKLIAKTIMEPQPLLEVKFLVHKIFIFLVNFKKYLNY